MLTTTFGARPKLYWLLLQPTIRVNCWVECMAHAYYALQFPTKLEIGLYV